jgi:hypothetical protein
VKAEPDGRLRLAPRPGVVRLVVTREQLQRALLIAQGLLKEAEQRGYEVRAVEKAAYDTRAGIAIVVREHAYPIEITEQTDRLPVTAAEIEDWQKRHRHRVAWDKREPPTHKSVANGRLRVSLPSHGNGARSNWTEGPRGSLAEKLASFFPELERRADVDDRRAEERARRQEAWRRAEDERQERELRLRIERSRVARLAEEIAAWRLAAEVRAYITALRAVLSELSGEDRDRVATWCDWAERWAAREDPVLNPGRIKGLDDDRDRFPVPG